jgi:ABC-type multidrug transport system ATPase subunit
LASSSPASSSCCRPALASRRSPTSISPDADLYIIDEPLANLDPESRDTAINLILDKTNGKTLVLVMHGSEEYHTLFDRVIRIDSNPGDSP